MKTVIYVLSWYFVFFSTSQEFFNRTYLAPWTNLSNNVALKDNEYFVLGQRLDTVNKKITLIRLNQNGDTLLTSFYGENDRAFFAQRLILRRNDLLVFGGVNYDDFGINTDFFLASFDYNFSLNWIKYYGGSYFDDGKDMLQNPDSSLMLCGTKSPTSANIEDFYLIKTDPDGNVLWEKTYGGANKDIANSIISSGNGNYIISGNSNSFTATKDLLIYNLDGDGNVQWQKTIGGNLEDYPGICSKLTDKSYILYKNFETSTIDPTASLCKINDHGDVIWQKNYLFSSYAAFAFSSPIELADGSIIVTAGSLNANQNPIGLVVKLDPLGNIIWQRDYAVRADRSQYIYDIQTTSDGGFVFCGSAFDSTNTQRAWVAKLDCFGCDGVLCDSSAVACEVYDCTGKDFEALISSTSLSIDLQNNQAVVFSNNATQTSNREWILPDTTFYTAGTVSYTFNTPGTYPVTLINYHGACSDTGVVMVEVYNSLGFGEMSCPKISLHILRI